MASEQEYAGLVHRLEQTKRREDIVLLATAFARTFSISLSLFALLSLVEVFARGSVNLRTALFGCWAASSLAVGVVFVGRQAWQRLWSAARPGVASIALRVGTLYDDLHDMLLNAMQVLSLAEAQQGVSSQLAIATFQAVEQRARSKDFTRIVDYAPIRRQALLGFIILAAFGVSSALSPLGSAANRLINFRQSFVPPAPFSLHIDPVYRNVLRAEKIRLRVLVQGTIPQTVVLHVREDQQQNEDSYTLHEDSVGVFVLDLGSIKRSIEYYAEVPWYSESVRSEIGHIVVSDLPLVRSIEGSVRQPSYTNLPPLAINDQHADISCLVGSFADIRINANKNLQRARICMQRRVEEGDSAKVAKQDTTIIPMSIRGAEASANFSIQASGQYWIDIEDADGRHNADPIHYTIIATADGYPSISLLQPQQDVVLGKDALLNIRCSITDDYGFSQLVLRYRLTESRYAPPEKDMHTLVLPLNTSSTSAEVPYIWDLNKANISPDDRFEFYVEVFDNDRIHGPKSARTGTLSLRLPSLDEVFRQAQQQQQDASKDLEKVMKQADEVAHQMDQLQRDLMKQKQMQADWKDKKKMEDLLKQQEQMQQKLSDVQQKLDDMTQKLQDNKALSPETLQKYMEMQKLLKSIDSKELRDAMEQMQKAMQQLSPEQMQQSMKNFKFNEEDFKKQIERTMQLLKRIQTEQKVDELTKRAQDLQEQQQQLERQAQNTNPSDKDAREQLANKQQALNEDMKKLAEQTKELEKMAKEAGLDKQQNVMDEMNKANDQLNAEMTQKQMQQSQQNMEQGDMQSAQKNMRNAEQNLSNFAQGMKRMKQQMKKNLQRETARQMQSSLNDMMSVSKAEEQLMKESEQMDLNSARMSENARQQQKLREQMMNLANKMNQLGQKSTAVTPEMGKEMGDAMRQMQGAQESMENRNAPMAAQQQRGAMSSMNQAMQQMSGALQKMGGNQPGSSGSDGDGEGDQNPGGSKLGGSGSFMQQLQQAANMQQGINQGMQQLGNGQGQGLSPEQQAEVGRLAAQQGKVQKSLEDLAREQKEGSGPKQATGSLEKLAQDMKEVLTDMQTGHITEETRRMQDHILSRLLDATRSMNERDYEKTRESTSGKDVSRKSPAELQLDALRKKQSVQDLLKSMQLGYTKDYEQLIRQYFESLQSQH